MKGDPEERAVRIGTYIVQTGATVRAAAKKYGVSKSTVHKDITQRLYIADRTLFHQVKRVTEHNKAQRHLRGGMATRKKYKG